MNAKISVFVICFEVIVYLLLYNLHDFTFEYQNLVFSFLTYVVILLFSPVIKHSLINKNYTVKENSVL